MGGWKVINYLERRNYNLEIWLVLCTLIVSTEHHHHRSVHNDKWVCYYERLFTSTNSI